MVLAVLVLAVAGAAAGLFVILNRAEGPAIELVRPTDLVGRSAVFEATVEAPRSELTALEAVIEQDGAAYPLFSLGDPAAADMRQEGPDRIRINRTFDRESHPEIRAGTATVRVSATRPVVFGPQRAEHGRWRSTSRCGFSRRGSRSASTFHYVNHGGSEAVVYTVSPPDSESGVRVGDRLYPGYPAAGLVEAAGDNLRLAFFALDYDQDLNTANRALRHGRGRKRSERPVRSPALPAQFPSLPHQRERRVPAAGRSVDRQPGPRSWPTSSRTARTRTSSICTCSSTAS